MGKGHLFSTNSAEKIEYFHAKKKKKPWPLFHIRYTNNSGWL